MKPKRSYYLTTPIYYVNDKPHIGHAYTTLACDVLARFKRLDGYDVMLLTGTDEHGQKVQKSAEEKGVDPQTFTDQVSQNFRDLTDTLNFSNDAFIRTTERRHYAACQKLWQELNAKGQIYLGSYAGWYAVRDEAFYAESEITDGKAPSGAPVEWVEEPSYFFRLSEYQERLLAHYKANPDFVAPESRFNEVRSFVSSGLNDLSISRASFSWGVPVPEESAPGEIGPGELAPGDSSHVMYVWLDALTNYMTAVGYGQDGGAGTYARRWPADLHMVGKDILRFHAVYWPAFLMAAELPLPKRVFAHGWWTNEGRKISKSLGNVIDPVQIAETYGLDQMRYFLLREVPFGNDGDFSHQAMVRRMNVDLANDLGNLCQRVLSMIFKNCDGKMPLAPQASQAPQASKAPQDLHEADRTMLIAADTLLAEQRGHYDRQAFHEALAGIWNAVREANQYVDMMAPWALRKTDPERMADVLWILAEVLRQIGILIQPVMPDAADAMLDQLGIDKDSRKFSHLGEKGRIIGGYEINPPRPIFPRFVEDKEGEGGT